MRRLPPKGPAQAALVAIATTAVLAASLALPAMPRAAASPAATGLVPDRAFSVPVDGVSSGTRAAISRLLETQAGAIRALDPEAYLGTFAGGGAGAVSSPQAAGQEVAGRPATRVRADLFGALPGGSTVELVGVTPLFFAPGPDGLVEVLARHLVAYRSADGPGIVEVDALERLRPRERLETGRRLAEPSWEVFDWTADDEATARPTWLTWLSGSVTLEPFDGRLTAELTYRFFPGFFPAASGVEEAVSFDLASTFDVDGVHGPTGELSWRRDGDSLTVTLPSPGNAPSVVSIAYHGHVVSAGTARRGNLDYLGAEAIYLRPNTGWYPRPMAGAETGGFLRGSVNVTVPAWWAAVAPGRMTSAGEAGTVGQVRVFTWSLDLPAELYLAAGPYLIAERRTVAGVTLRTFFYAREAAWADGYLEEAERILDFYGERFGPYPYGNLSLAEVQDFFYGGLSARTLVLIEKAWQGDPRVDTWARDLLAHEISHQWWGEVVPVVGDADWFLWEGLASYCEGLYAEYREGPGGLARVMEEKTASYAKAARWHPEWSIREANVRTSDWQDDFVYDKGAWVFHVLRFLLGDDGFYGFLRTYIDRFAGRQPGTADMASLVARSAPDDPYLTEFTTHWVDQAGQPDLTLSGLSAGRAGDDGNGRAGCRLSFDLLDQGPTAFPRAEVRVVLADGTSRTLEAAAGHNDFDLPGPVRSVQVDPSGKVLDLARSNNTWYILAGVSFPVSAVGPALAGLAAIPVAAFVLGGLLRSRRRPRSPRPLTPPGRDATL